MAGVSHKHFGNATVLDFQKFGQVWPVSMDPAILQRLEDSARKVKGRYTCFERSRLRFNFTEMTSLAEVRCALFDLLETRAFRREFTISFADFLPAISDAVAHRATLDDLTQYDLDGSLAKRLAAPLPVFA